MQSNAAEPDTCLGTLNDNNKLERLVDKDACNILKDRRFRIFSCSCYGLLCAITISIAALAGPSPWEEHSEAANNAYNAKNYAGAEKFASSALADAEHFGEFDDRLVLSIHNLAQVYKVEKRFADAEKLYKRSVELNTKLYGKVHPAVADVYARLASLYEEQKNLAEAERLYKMAISTHEAALGTWDPGLNTLLEKMSEFLKSQNKVNEANSYANRAKLIRGSYARYQKCAQQATELCERANYEAASGRFEVAIGLYSDAIKVFPNSYAGYSNRAGCYNNLKRHDLALLDYNKAIYLSRAVKDKQLPFIISFRAATLRNMGRTKEAIKDMQVAVELVPDSAFLWNNLGKAHDAAGNFTQALNAFDKALFFARKRTPVLHDEIGNIMYFRAVTYEHMGKNEKALSEVSEALKEFEQASADAAMNFQPSAYELRAKLYRAAGKSDRAQADLAAAKSCAASSR